MLVHSHRLTLGRAKECQMILRLVTNSRPADRGHEGSVDEQPRTSLTIEMRRRMSTSISVVSLRVFDRVQTVDQHLSGSCFHLPGRTK